MIPGLELVVRRALGVGDEARDAVQETLARALRAIENGTEIRGSLAGFVHGIAMHVLADVHRGREREAVVSVDWAAIPTSVSSALDEVVAEQERGTMLAALSALDADERLLLHRCFVDGQSIAAIARHDGVPAARIRKRKSRALKRLRALLARARANGHTPAVSATKKRWPANG